MENLVFIKVAKNLTLHNLFILFITACGCNTTFSTGLCAEGTGQCECKSKYSGKKCDQCNKGYYDFPECKSKLQHFHNTFNKISSI